MNKRQLIEALADSAGITLRSAEVVVDTAINNLEQALVSGDRVEIRGFWTFKVKDYEGYEGRNQKTLEKVEVGPKKLPFFRVGQEFNRRINLDGAESEGDDDSDLQAMGRR